MSSGFRQSKNHSPNVLHWLHQSRRDNARTGQEQMQAPKIPNTGGNHEAQNLFGSHSREELVYLVVIS